MAAITAANGRGRCPMRSARARAEPSSLSEPSSVSRPGSSANCSCSAASRPGSRPTTSTGLPASSKAPTTPGPRHRYHRGPELRASVSHSRTFPPKSGIVPIRRSRSPLWGQADGAATLLTHGRGKLTKVLVYQGTRTGFDGHRRSRVLWPAFRSRARMLRRLMADGLQLTNGATIDLKPLLD